MFYFHPLIVLITYPQLWLKLDSTLMCCGKSIQNQSIMSRRQVICFGLCNPWFLGLFFNLGFYFQFSDDVSLATLLNITGGFNTTNATTEAPEEEEKPVYSCEKDEIGILENPCYMHTYDTLLKQLRGIAEVILVLWSIVYLGIAVREFTFLPVAIFMQNMALCPSRVGFLLGKFMAIL